MTSNGRRPQMEDDLKIWEVEYLSHHWSYLTQDLSLWDQRKTTSNGRRPAMEDNLQWKMSSDVRRPPREEDLQGKMTSNERWPQSMKIGSHWSNISQNLNISSWDHTKVQQNFNEDDHNWRRPQTMKIWISLRPLKVVLFIFIHYFFWLGCLTTIKVFTNYLNYLKNKLASFFQKRLRKY